MERVTQINIKLIPMYTLTQVAIAFKISDLLQSGYYFKYWRKWMLEIEFQLQPHIEALIKAFSDI